MYPSASRVSGPTEAQGDEGARFKPAPKPSLGK